MAALSPIICGPLALIFLRNCFVSCLSDLLSKAFLVVMRMRLRSSGFRRKSYAPNLSAWTAVSTSPCPVIITTGHSPFASLASFSPFLSFARNSKPSISGILISEKMRSYDLACAISKPCLPFSATSTSCPSSARISLSVLRMPRSSSIISIFAMVMKTLLNRAQNYDFFLNYASI